MVVSLEQRGEDGGDGIRLARGLHANATQRGELVEKLQVELLERLVDYFGRFPGHPHQIHQVQIVVTAALALISRVPCSRRITFSWALSWSIAACGGWCAASTQRR